MRLLSILILIFMLCLQKCGQKQVPARSEENEKKIILVSENQKYGLSCVFYGEEMKMENGRSEKIIQEITIRANSTGRETRYIPSDEVSVRDSLGYFTNVWSPDEEYLVLPRGRFHGFCIVRSSIAVESIASNECSDFIAVAGKEKYPIGLWHNFVQWDSNDSFIFTAGLSGYYVPIRYSITSGSLSFMDNKNILDNAEGESQKGKIPIAKEKK